MFIFLNHILGDWHSPYNGLLSLQTLFFVDWCQKPLEISIYTVSFISPFKKAVTTSKRTNTQSLLADKAMTMRTALHFATGPNTSSKYAFGLSEPSSD